ncbi:MAG: DUF4190 domain-containing protein [Coriobacteriaceae bacterium]|nr:DUF4190 domain-containing protein [Coriobacteriaceae bacterium]
MSEQDASPIQAQPEGSEQQPVAQPVQQQNGQAFQQPYQQPAQQQWQQQQPGQQQWQQPYQQQWQQPYAGPYGQPAPTGPKNSHALIALICGIAAIVISPSIILSLALSIVAIVFAIKARKVAPDGKATAGLVLGIIGTVLSVAMIFVLALCIVPLAQNGWKMTSSSPKSSSAPKASLADSIGGEIVADDAICTVRLTRMEIDDKGDLNIYFTLKNNASRSDVKLDIHTKSGQAWELNGKKVEAVAFSWADGGQTKDDQCITIPSSYLDDIESVDDVKSISGILVVDFGSTSHDLEYPVDLYV